jgi:predicted MPP superfamily phosphohydrolase
MLVREEHVAGLNLATPVRLLYASDLHLGRPWNRGVPAEIARIVRDTRPAAALLGGDLADTAAGLPALAALTKTLTTSCPIFAVPGNHDRRVGVERVRAAIESAGGTWLDTASLGPLRLAAQADQPADVLVAHDPAGFDAAVAAGFRLVFAGHLHGGQCVLFTRHRNLLYPGAFFARYTGLRFERDRTTMLVSRGAADTIPLRFNCPREVILCTLT